MSVGEQVRVRVMCREIVNSQAVWTREIWDGTIVKAYGLPQGNQSLYRVRFESGAEDNIWEDQIVK